MIRTLAAFMVLTGAWLCAEDEPPLKMTTYQVAFLKRGPKWTSQSTPETQKIQEGHMANIRAMAATGKLIVAGPFADDSNLRGMYVFKATAEEARHLAEQDPAVKAGRLTLEWHPWFAAEGIGVTQDHTGEQKK